MELLTKIIKENKCCHEDDIASIIFTMTNDLNAEFPAKSARIHLEWSNIPMVCFQELPVPGSLKMCLRVLMLVNTTLNQDQIKHIYLRDAKSLRPDLALN